MFKPWQKLLLATTTLAPLGFAPVLANPLGAQVVGGTATEQGQGTASVTVNQTADKAIINWNTFNIGAGEKTQFVQPSASSVALNRVTGGLGPSQIFGTLSANGQIFVVNPDGILFGPAAKIDTAGFLATTHDIANADFMAGRYNFSIPGRTDASIVNQGTITAQTGGFAALVAPGVRNTGTISARLGQVALASGNSFSLDFYGDRLISLGLTDSIAASVKDVATGETLKSLVSNEGKLKANGGTVQLTAVAAREVVDSVINTSGVIEANSIGTHNGMIVLGATTAATKPAGLPTQSVKVSGALSAAGRHPNTSGGKVQVTGEDIQVTGATMNASGASGGGTVLVGGDTGGGNPSAAALSSPKAQLEPYVLPTATTVSVDATSKIDASAKAAGQGGKVIVWADNSTNMAGAISARGGPQSGNGGFVEVSGYRQLGFSGRVDTGASNGSRGTLLLDPQDVTIGTSGTWTISPAALESALASGDVLIGTDNSKTGSGNVTVAQSFSWNSASTLIIGAYRNVVINDGVTVSNTGAGTLDIGAGITSPNGSPWYGNGTGTILFNGNGKIDFSVSSGYVNFAYNPPGGYGSPTDFTAHVIGNGFVSNQFNAFMWINGIADLQNINLNLSGKYALANNIDASATQSWNGGAGFLPIGSLTSPFSGWLTGIGGSAPFITQGATIDHLTINSPASQVGLFAYIGSSGVVENIGLTNAAVTGTFTSGPLLPINPIIGSPWYDGGQFVGALAGQNDGLIINSSTSGSVSAASWGLVGGLAGLSIGTIFGSHSSGDVSAAPNGIVVGNVGGLVAANEGVILKSYSTASVSGVGYLGGLAAVSEDILGRGTSHIDESFATGNVIVYGSGYAGGLVGDNSRPIMNSYATGSVFGTSNVPLGSCYSCELAGLAAINNNSITASYATGTVSDIAGHSTFGGLVDVANPFLSATALNSYWDTQSTTQSASAGGTGLTTAQLKAGLPSGFDSFIWGSSGAVNAGYPYLLWQAPSAPPSAPTILLPSSVTASGPAAASNVVASQPTLQLATLLQDENDSSQTTPKIITDISGNGSVDPTPNTTLVLGNLITDPSSWATASKVESLIHLILDLRKYKDAGELIQALNDAGVPVSDAAKATFEKAATSLSTDAAKIALDTSIDLILDHTNSNFPRSVAHSLADTAFNMITLNLKAQIVDQAFLIAQEATALRKESQDLTLHFEAIGRSIAADIEVGKSDRLLRIGASTQQTLDAQADALIEGNIWQPQVETGRDWTLISKLIDVIRAQQNGGNVQATLGQVKALAATYDTKDNELYNAQVPISALTALGNPNPTKYADYAKQIANQFGLAAVW